MIARLLLSTSLEVRVNAIEEELEKNNLTKRHPDLLYFQQGEKLGIAEARKIKEHFSLKPYSAKGRGVILEDASSLTAEAQNALLKSLEELPENAILILGAPSDANLFPTILSRCQITHIKNPTSHHTPTSEVGYIANIEKLLSVNLEERLQFIEKLKEREDFLSSLVTYFRQLLYTPGPARLEVTEFLKELLQAEKWAKQNVNIRAVLEYLMLVMPFKI